MVHDLAIASFFIVMLIAPCLATLGKGDPEVAKAEPIAKNLHR